MAHKTNKLGSRLHVATSRRLEQLESRLVMSGTDFATVVANDVVTMRLAPDNTVVTSRSTSGLDAKLNSDFVWGYQRAPQDLGPEFTKFEVVVHEFFPVVNGVRDESRADEQLTRDVARRVAAMDRMLVVNIETWHTDVRTWGDAVVSQSIAKYGEVLDWIRDEEPDLKIGLYGMFPLREYQPASFDYFYENHWGNPADSNQFAVQSRRLAELHHANDRLAELAAKVDVIYPSLYSFYSDQTQWGSFAEHMIAESKRYGKPVVPFVMGTYHPGANPSSLRGQNLSPEFWQFQMDTVRRLADGMVLFSSEEQLATAMSQPWMQQFLDAGRADAAARTASLGEGDQTGTPNEPPTVAPPDEPVEPTPDPNEVVDTLPVQPTHTWFDLILLAARQRQGSDTMSAIGEINDMMTRADASFTDLISDEALHSQIYHELTGQGD
jgi:hypothetical protein